MGESIITLSLGRRSGNLLPVAQRTNALTTTHSHTSNWQGPVAQRTNALTTHSHTSNLKGRSRLNAYTANQKSRSRAWRSASASACFDFREASYTLVSSRSATSSCRRRWTTWAEVDTSAEVVHLRRQHDVAEREEAKANEARPKSKQAKADADRQAL